MARYQSKVISRCSQGTQSLIVIRRPLRNGQRLWRDKTLIIRYRQKPWTIHILWALCLGKKKTTRTIISWLRSSRSRAAMANDVEIQWVRMQPLPFPFHVMEYNNELNLSLTCRIDRQFQLWNDAPNLIYSSAQSSIRCPSIPSSVAFPLKQMAHPYWV